MKFRYGISPSIKPKFYKNIGPKFIWGAIGIHLLNRKVEIEWNFNRT